jgi:hypothetical protein
MLGSWPPAWGIKAMPLLTLTIHRRGVVDHACPLRERVRELVHFGVHVGRTVHSSIVDHCLLGEGFQQARQASRTCQHASQQTQAFRLRGRIAEATEQRRDRGVEIERGKRDRCAVS